MKHGDDKFKWFTLQLSTLNLYQTDYSISGNKNVKSDSEKKKYIDLLM
jgi:hypothetical protein